MKKYHLQTCFFFLMLIALGFSQLSCKKDFLDEDEIGEKFERVVAPGELDELPVRLKEKAMILDDDIMNSIVNISEDGIVVDLGSELVKMEVGSYVVFNTRKINFLMDIRRVTEKTVGSNQVVLKTRQAEHFEWDEIFETLRITTQPIRTSSSRSSDAPCTQETYPGFVVRQDSDGKCWLYRAVNEDDRVNFRTSWLSPFLHKGLTIFDGKLDFRLVPEIREVSFIPMYSEVREKGEIIAWSLSALDYTLHDLKFSVSLTALPRQFVEDLTGIPKELKTKDFRAPSIPIPYLPGTWVDVGLEGFIKFSGGVIVDCEVVSDYTIDFGYTTDPSLLPITDHSETRRVLGMDLETGSKCKKGHFRGSLIGRIDIGFKVNVGFGFGKDAKVGLGVLRTGLLCNLWRFQAAASVKYDYCADYKLHHSESDGVEIADGLATGSSDADEFSVDSMDSEILDYYLDQEDTYSLLQSIDLCLGFTSFIDLYVELKPTNPVVDEISDLLKDYEHLPVYGLATLSHLLGGITFTLARWDLFWLLEEVAAIFGYDLSEYDGATCLSDWIRPDYYDISVESEVVCVGQNRRIDFTIGNKSTWYSDMEGPTHEVIFDLFMDNPLTEEPFDWVEVRKDIGPWQIPILGGLTSTYEASVATDLIQIPPENLTLSDHLGIEHPLQLKFKLVNKSYQRPEVSPIFDVLLTPCVDNAVCFLDKTNLTNEGQYNFCSNYISGNEWMLHNVLWAPMGFSKTRGGRNLPANISTLRNSADVFALPGNESLTNGTYFNWYEGNAKYGTSVRPPCPMVDGVQWILPTAVNWDVALEELRGSWESWSDYAVGVDYNNGHSGFASPQLSKGGYFGLDQDGLKIEYVRLEEGVSYYWTSETELSTLAPSVYTKLISDTIKGGEFFSDRAFAVRIDHSTRKHQFVLLPKAAALPCKCIAP